MRDYLEEITLKPLTGIPVAVAILLFSFLLVRYIGEGLINYVAGPIFEKFYRPFITIISSLLGSEGFIHDLLVGQLIEGSIDFEQSFGVLTTGLYIPFAAVLPYIIAFYLMLGILEDTGFLPRLAVLVDNVMHRVGLHGYSIIPMILGFGCNVPAALAARTLDSRREKFIASTLMAIAIPCMAQTAMVFGLLGAYGVRYIVFVYAALFLVWIVIGLILDEMLPGYSSDLLLEIPAFRFPGPRTVMKKLWMRVSGFLREALPFVIFGVLLVNFLYIIGIFRYFTEFFGPFFSYFFGLPREAVVALLMGFLRKDLAMGMLAPLGLTAHQLVVASTILTIYFPCAATFVVLVRELGVSDMLKAVLIMLAVTLFVGGGMNFILGGWSNLLLGILIIIGVFIFIFSPWGTKGLKDKLRG